MRVAINGWFWDDPYAGSGQYVRQLVLALADIKSELQLTLILPPHIKKPQEVPTNVEVVHASTPMGGKVGKVWFEQRSYPAAVKKIGADIAHVPYWGAPLSSPAKLIVSVLDVIPLALPVYRQGFFNNLYVSLVRSTAQGAGHILTLSEASKQDIIKYLEIPADQITPTYLAADERYTAIADPAADEAVRQKYDLPDEFALYFGSFDIRKNVNQLLLAWTYVGQPMAEFVPLVLAGRQPKEWGTPLFPDLKAYAKELNIEHYLQWIGEVDEVDKPALYRLAKVLIFPSLYEGFGLPPLEAMACGTPVVTGKVSSLPEVVGDAAYLVDPRNERDMAGAILALLVQDDLHQHMSNLGRGRASNFSWRKTALKTLQVYRDIMQA